MKYCDNGLQNALFMWFLSGSVETQLMVKLYIFKLNSIEHSFLFALVDEL